MKTAGKVKAAGIVLLGSICLGPVPGIAQPASLLQGDPRAVERAELLVKRMGGRDLWLRSKGFYVEYLGWQGERGELVEERAWRDLEQPRQRAEFEGRSYYNIFAFSPESGWVSRSGAVRALTPE